MALNKNSLSEQLYQDLRRRIMMGEIPSGEKLNIKELQTQFQVSATPVREALMRLSQDRFVENYTNQYTKVVELSDKDVSNLIDICCLFDGYAMRYMLGQPEERREELVQELQNSIDRQLFYIEHPDAVRDQYEGMFNEFHQILYSHCDNPWLLHTATQNNNLLYVADARRESKAEYPIAAAQEHQAILDAFRSGDAGETLARIEEHRRNEKARFCSSPDRQ